MQIDTILNTLQRQGLACDKPTILFILTQFQRKNYSKLTLSTVTNSVKLDASLVESLADTKKVEKGSSILD